MYNLEHPDITRTMRIGYPHRLEGDVPRCDCCGEELDSIFYRFQDEALCEECLVKTAVNLLQEEPSLAAEFLMAKMEVSA